MTVHKNIIALSGSRTGTFKNKRC